jgi:SAM-dependent methyltransferase
MQFLRGEEYDKKANLQKFVARDLVEFASGDLQNANVVLDVGCGTGFVGREVLKRFSAVKMLGIEPSLQMSRLAKPYYDEIFNCKFEDFTGIKVDLMLSSMCFQWIDDFEKRLEKFDKFWFAIPLEGSFLGLNEAFLKAGIKSPILEFRGASFKPFCVKEYRFEYSSALMALKSFNEVGAKNPASARISHNDIKKVERFFDGKLEWRIGFFQI